MAIEYRMASGDRPPLEIHRSTRRRRTASAAARDGTLVIRLPAAMPDDEAEATIARLVRRVLGAGRAAARGGDDHLRARAERLADRYVDGVRPTAVTWSSRMSRQHGSCSSADGTIRISSALASAPDAVLDHVIIHELAHLRHPDHGADFARLVARHEHADWARGWLAGHAAGMLGASAWHDAGTRGPAVDADTADHPAP
ncbi:MAG: M48 family metallopeptidase [Nitriliruptoraceae bacterium]